MTVHPDARRFLDIVAGSPPADTQTVEQNRADLSNALPLTGATTELPYVEDTTIAGVPVRLYSATPVEHDAPAVIYFHGGGWVIGDLEIADTTARDLAKYSGALVVSVDYRKAPEAPFPAAIQDALAVTEAVLRGDSALPIDVSRVAVAGDSAGGTLAAVTAQQLRGHQPALVHQALIYPTTELSTDLTGSFEEFAEGYYLTVRDIEYCYSTYAGENRRDVLASPGLNPDLSNLPDATVITGGCDPLRDQAEAYAQAMAEAGNTVTSVRFNGLVHPFFYLAGVIDGANSARRFVGVQLQAALMASLVKTG
ncbi:MULTISPECIES: alpha/beta hydrolase [Microbacterium]|jgi:acetyl esterase|uniref:Alpha/beta hydrolase n=1 Tax=Microbacterium schleiferi TaxID=69362 RepID=A0A7S8MY77_9MICO|nr:alpha/beta hydrolase [Microbacterium schleiferi]QPE04545.1 alpha/beta hydrolase [Microbacterium schleiferi]